MDSRRSEFVSCCDFEVQLLAGYCKRRRDPPRGILSRHGSEMLALYHQISEVPLSCSCRWYHSCSELISEKEPRKEVRKGNRTSGTSDKSIVGTTRQSFCVLRESPFVPYHNRWWNFKLFVCEAQPILLRSDDAGRSRFQWCLAVSRCCTKFFKYCSSYQASIRCLIAVSAEADIGLHPLIVLRRRG